jgi:hypothetical protein
VAKITPTLLSDRLPSYDLQRDTSDLGTDRQEADAAMNDVTQMIPAGNKVASATSPGKLSFTFASGMHASTEEKRENKCTSAVVQNTLQRTPLALHPPGMDCGVPQGYVLESEEFVAYTEYITVVIDGHLSRRHAGPR